MNQWSSLTIKGWWNYASCRTSPNETHYITIMIPMNNYCLWWFTLLSAAQISRCVLMECSKQSWWIIQGASTVTVLNPRWNYCLAEQNSCLIRLYRFQLCYYLPLLILLSSVICQEGEQSSPWSYITLLKTKWLELNIEYLSMCLHPWTCTNYLLRQGLLTAWMHIKLLASWYISIWRDFSTCTDDFYLWN